MDPPHTVSEINRYLSTLISDDPLLSDLWVTGEVSNWTQARSGHCYFTLKDDEAEIRCVMWRASAERLVTLPRDGDAIVAAGYFSLYEARGQLQFYVQEMQPLGMGALFERFERLKRALAAEGLFDVAHKRALPLFPRRIGIVTSPTAAALQDILNVLRRRQPLVEVLLSPTLVQGASAPASIVRAIKRFDAVAVDLVIVARGGGSIEDLWAFNDEAVARAIYACTIPLICGVGHEVDTTIADYVADQRAPTPSAAAELAVPDAATLRDGLRELHGRLALAMNSEMTAARQRLASERRALERLSPQNRLRNRRQSLDYAEQRLQSRAEHQVARRRAAVATLEARLSNLNPTAILNRGYAVVTNEAGERVQNATSVAEGALLRLRLHDGAWRVRTVEREL
ncbi:MAG: exodeoxyribonuclease VII large subunit [Anaerolineales bacterium]|nr:exodeoxyribonuclease VII large subunit [Anaerolineales bacterium]MCB9129122.1 exodeoxyribonuclease VII large subunit [Ardenticatenales bacterium]